MFFQKIGKSKHKFKVSFTFAKLKSQQLEKGSRIKVKVQRGSHSIDCWSNPVKKGIAKFPQQQHIIPITLFYDEDKADIQYLQKQATVKVYSQNYDENMVKIGWFTLDLAQYAKETQIGLQTQLETQFQQAPIISFQLRFHSEDQNSKSVETYSSNNQTKKVTEQSYVHEPLHTVLQEETEKSQIKQSSSLQLYTAQKALKSKQVELYKAQKKNEGYEKTIQQLIERNVEIGRQKMNNYGDEQKFKKKLIEKELQLDDVKHKYRELKLRQEHHEKTIANQRKQLRDWKEKTIKQKYKMAQLMQQCFETGNQQMIELLSKYLQL